jgi:hypothetical protein
MNGFAPSREEAENDLEVAIEVMGIIEEYIASNSK